MQPYYTQRITLDSLAGRPHDTLADLHKLLTWPEGWNGYNACAPKHEAVNHAIEWINQLFLEVMDSNQNWIKPNITASGEGEAVLGWRHDAKRLTVYIDEKSAEYVQAWGPDMDKEMNDAMPIFSAHVNHSGNGWLQIYE